MGRVQGLGLLDRESGNRNKDLELSVAKTIAGFANAHGGTLLIGVNDDGEAVGPRDDFRLANQKRQDADGYENWLTTMLAEVLGKVATAYLAVTFTATDGTLPSRRCEACRRPDLHARPEDGRRLYVRSTIRLASSTRLTRSSTYGPTGDEIGTQAKSHGGKDLRPHTNVVPPPASINIAWGQHLAPVMHRSTFAGPSTHHPPSHWGAQRVRERPERVRTRRGPPPSIFTRTASIACTRQAPSS